MEAQGRRYFPYLAMSVLGALGAVLGFHLETLTLRALLLAIFGAVAGGILALPYDRAVGVLFAYLGFEGMAKIVTQYHPVVHVGADLLVILLTVRWIGGWFLRRNRIPQNFPPLLPLFAIHFAWFLVQFANPYSLGPLPSIAAAKIYVTMVVLYGYGYYLSKNPSTLRGFMAIWVFTIAVQSVTGLAQAVFGPQSVLNISPHYAAPLAKFNSSYAFRPFGTTAVPGAPSVYVFLGISFVVYFLLTARASADSSGGARGSDGLGFRVPAPRPAYSPKRTPPIHFFRTGFLRITFGPRPSPRSGFLARSLSP